MNTKKVLGKIQTYNLASLSFAKLCLHFRLMTAFPMPDALSGLEIQVAALK